MSIVNRFVRCTQIASNRVAKQSIRPAAFVSINQTFKSNHISARTYFSNPSPRSLNEIVHLDKLNPLPPESVVQVWLEHHRDALGTTALADVITQQQYEILMERTQKYPLFVLPIFRDSDPTKQHEEKSEIETQPDPASSTTPGKPAYETVVLNWQGDHLLFTSLASYQKHGSQAGPLLVCTLYPDLMHEKGIVLVRVEVVSPLVTLEDAKRLLSFTWKFYSDLKEIEGGSEDWVHKFNKESSTFNFDAFIDKVYQMR